MENISIKKENDAIKIENKSLISDVSNLNKQVNELNKANQLMKDKIIGLIENVDNMSKVNSLYMGYMQ